jgi:sulfite exporter TauE/SafE
MLAFGLGTLPNLMAAAALLERSHSWFAGRTARMISGGAVMAFGVYGIARTIRRGPCPVVVQPEVNPERLAEISRIR